MNRPAIAPSAGPVSLKLTDLAVTYLTSRGALPAVGPIDLDVAPGEFVALIGPSGCGKSTLLKVAGGLLPPSSGRLAFVPESRRRRGDTGFVFQTPTLLPWKTVRDNVLVPARILGIDDAVAGRVADDLLERVGLADFARHYPGELSGGMQQRVSIARSLAADPDILLMDEPFSALDALTREQMMIELQSIWERSGKSVLFVTHSIPEAVFMADRVVVLSPRPARIVHVEPVGLPRPRGLDTLRDPALITACDRLRRILAEGRQTGHE